MFGDHPDDWTERHEIPDIMWLSVQVFQSVCGQWRVDFSGPSALDYNVLPWVFETFGVEAGDRMEVFQDVRTMERAALDAMKSHRQAAG